MFGKAIVAIGVALSISACATQLYEGKYSFYEGWRKGRVLRVDTTDEVFARKIWKCRPREVASQWAAVRYLNGGHLSYVGVPLAPSDSFKAQEFVYVNTRDCTLGVRTQVPVKARV